jgi:hypothetical protein
MEVSLYANSLYWVCYLVSEGDYSADNLSKSAEIQQGAGRF